MITLAWMTVEAAVSLGAAWRAHSPALLGFGGDSGIELLSAAIVWWRFSPGAGTEKSEATAARLTGALLFALAGIVGLGALMAFAGRIEPRPSPVGVVLLILAAAIMPWLARKKRRLAVRTGSAALKAMDTHATRSMPCKRWPGSSSKSRDDENAPAAEARC